MCAENFVPEDDEMDGVPAGSPEDDDMHVEVSDEDECWHGDIPPECPYCGDLDCECDHLLLATCEEYDEPFAGTACGCVTHYLKDASPARREKVWDIVDRGTTKTIRVIYDPAQPGCSGIFDYRYVRDPDAAERWFAKRHWWLHLTGRRGRRSGRFG